MQDDLEHCRQAGAWAREAGRPASSCPTFAPGRLGQPARDAWMAGWNEADKKLAKGCRP